MLTHALIAFVAGAYGVLALSCPPITAKKDLDLMLYGDFFTAGT